MIELLKSIKDNYDIFIDTNKIHKLGATKINDIFLINIDNKKYIVKIYNYVQSNFPIKLIDGFSNAYKKMCLYLLAIDKQILNKSIEKFWQVLLEFQPDTIILYGSLTVDVLKKLLKNH